ncbi:MAG: hypothetical protein ACKVIN_06235 [Longimicrobiales bacterium]
MTEGPFPLLRRARCPLPWRASVVAAIVFFPITGCEPVDPALIPDAQLQAELGLTEDDRIHTVQISTGVGERSDPDAVTVSAGEFVQLVSTDWFVHEVRFDLDAMALDTRAFLERTGQTVSPPLLQEGSRFVLSFANAPAGRYPYLLEGNRESGLGEIVVASPEGG